MTEGEVKKCPECGTKMEQGYVISEAVFWSKEKHTQWALGQERIIPRGFWALPNVEAYRCMNCKLVLFHYGKPGEAETPNGFLKKCVQCGKEIPIAAETCYFCGKRQAKKKGNECRLYREKDFE